MTNAGIKVYPVNKNADGGDYDVKVYNSISQLPDKSDIACVMVGKEKVLTAIEELNEQGVKKVLVQSKRMVDDKTEEFCMENNIELTIGCALMAEGKGLHRFHGFLAGGVK